MTERVISCSVAIAEALTEEMARDETIFIIGEDLVAHGGIFGQFKGLPERFPGRVIDSPISEACIVGAGLGAAEKAPHASAQVRPIADPRFEFQPASAGEVVADRSLARTGMGVRLPLRGQANGRLCDGSFLRAASPRQVFHFPPAHVAGAEIHPGMHALRISAKDGLDGAERFDEILPVDRAEVPQARDAVADGCMDGGLVLAFSLMDQFQGLPSF